jgi:hypothetical protein
VYSCRHEQADFLRKVEFLHGETVAIECLIGSPHGMICSDSLLLFYDRHSAKSITIFNTKRNKYMGRTISEGKGPEEVIPPLRGLNIFQNKFYTLEAQTGNMVIFNISDTIRFDQKISFEKRPMELRKTKQYYIGTDLFGENRFQLYDLDGNILLSTGHYPFNEGKSGMEHSFLYQGQLCASPGNNSFAFACLLCDDLEFYELRNDSCNLLKQYLTTDVNAEWIDNRLRYNDNTFINYTSSYSTENFCYMLYAGKSFKDNGGPVLGQHVIVFDWTGNYQRTFGLDVPVTSFCVDENGKCIYATAYSDDELSIKKFNY